MAGSFDALECHHGKNWTLSGVTMEAEAPMEASFRHFSILLITQLSEKKKIFSVLSFVRFLFKYF